MPWHTSKSDPRKVYDETHTVVGVMQNAAQAAMIIEAVNALGPERYNASRKECANLTRSLPARETITHTHQEDECCGKHIVKAIRSDAVSVAAVWGCPKCGQEWRARKIGETMFHWVPQPLMEVI